MTTWRRISDQKLFRQTSTSRGQSFLSGVPYHPMVAHLRADDGEKAKVPLWRLQQDRTARGWEPADE